MSCGNCATTTGGCGCQQTALQINQVCNPIVCTTNQCSESFNAACIIYTGDDIETPGGVILGTNGDTIAQIMANISAYFSTGQTGLQKSWASVTGIGNGATAGDVLVFQDTIKAYTLSNIGDEIELEVYYDSLVLGPVNVKFDFGGGDVYTYTIVNPKDLRGIIRVNFTRLSQTSQLVYTEDKNIDSLNNPDLEILRSSLTFDCNVDNLLQVIVENTVGGANQIEVFKVTLKRNKIA